jgi:phospholipase C
MSKLIKWSTVIAFAAGLASCGGATDPSVEQQQLSQNNQGATDKNDDKSDRASKFKTATPIKHLVVIFQENVSFDHYFATYPVADNGMGENAFTALPNTPTANTLSTPLDPTNNFAALSSLDLLNKNPNGPMGSGATGNSPNAQNPFRLTPLQGATADQDHDYTPEQQAFDNSLMDLFPEFTGVGSNTPPQDTTPPLNTSALTMGYYDGNTVTALWYYAQHFAMSDNSFETVFGPSTVGALNLISGQTNGVIKSNADKKDLSGEVSNDGDGGATVTGDPQPLGDVCSSRDQVQMGGENVGDLLNKEKISWGFFQGGFDLTQTNENGTTGCSRKSTSPTTQSLKVDYIPHHQPFQYYASTQNLSHARPSSISAIGYSFQDGDSKAEPANHQYDIHDFFDALAEGNFPAVSFLKAPGYQDGHAGYSSPQDEQTFLVKTINTIEQTPEWSSTAILILWDDSDGWYDHQMSPITNPSTNTQTASNVTMNMTAVTGNPDALNGNGLCNSSAMQQGGATPATPLLGNGKYPAQGRCGYGPRLPFLVISPYAKANYIDHTLTDQTSPLRFIEDNWLKKKRIAGSFDKLAGDLTGASSVFSFDGGVNGPLFLDPATGNIVDCPTCY